MPYLNNTVGTVSTRYTLTPSHTLSLTHTHTHTHTHMHACMHAITTSHTYCTSGDWLTSRPKGCSQPRELWFFDILMYSIPSLSPSLPPSLPPSSHMHVQIEEVMEFVLLFEKDLKILNQFLSVSKERLQLSREMGGQHSEEAWKILTEVSSLLDASLVERCPHFRRCCVQHSCQPSRNGRDSPGSLGLVPAVSRSRQGPGIYRLASASTRPLTSVPLVLSDNSETACVFSSHYHCPLHVYVRLRARTNVMRDCALC